MVLRSFNTFRSALITLAGMAWMLALAPAAARAPRECDEGNGGISLPDGFCASLFADNLGHARHLVVAPTGDVYVNTWGSHDTTMQHAASSHVVALRDADRDGRAETIERFGPTRRDGSPGGGTGIALHRGSLYVESYSSIVRYALPPGAFVPAADPETIVTELPLDGDHQAHPFAITPDGDLFVNSGSASNACQEHNRTRQSPGQLPCHELDTRGGIFRFDSEKPNQKFMPQARYATGLRNAVALAVQKPGDALFAAVHGRDQLSDHWPLLYTDTQNNELPAETLVHIEKGDDFGWPYCYFDAPQNDYAVAPEYRREGEAPVRDCSRTKRPEVAFPAHWAPDGLAFYTGSEFPASYRGGAFVAFHGSWNRKPTQAGFSVIFVPFANGRPLGQYQAFASGFAGAPVPADPNAAAYRPVGVAVGGDGALYVSDDVKGRIWRITYAGSGTR